MKYFISGIVLCLLGVNACAQTPENTPEQTTVQTVSPALSPASTQTAGPPSSCTATGFEFKNNEILFNNDGANPRVFILHNTSPGTVMINHIKSDPGASAGWASNLNKNNWSMLAMSQANFSMGCMLYKPPQFGLIDCAKVISVCSIPSKTGGGGFWVAENAALEKIIATAKGRGFDM